MSRWAAVLAGGSGTRFWPLSTNQTPKQMLPLAGPDPLLVQSVRRLTGLIEVQHILVVTAAHLCEATRALLPEIPAANILGEPRAASTGPALAWATSLAAARDPHASVMSLHADWFVGDDRRFRETASRAFDVAEKFDVLVTVGMTPTRPDTGYGYIRPGAVLDADARRVEQFVEKPNEQRARTLITEGALWNSGMFAWTAKRFDAETRAHAPEIAPHLPRLASGDVSGFFAAVTPVAVDISHFERSDRVAVLPGRFPWDDPGNWGGLGRVRQGDHARNVVVGAGTVHEAAENVVWADDGPVVLFGVHDLVVVRANGVVLVATKEHAARLKDLLAVLPAELRDLKK
ncbi:MAG: mannose-1-phosphate guanylyltransferase [Gemmatimonadetes bacterium]|nr:mannose-1-phosphate guanylyltransferase [Gemmatimonadota bacterium]